MKFLIDRCAGRVLADWLREQGHDVVESRTWGSDPGDEEILRRATLEGRILVSMDKDFGALIFFREHRHCGLVRLPDVSAHTRIALMQQILQSHAEDLAAGAVVTIRGSRIRVTGVSRGEGN